MDVRASVHVSVRNLVVHKLTTQNQIGKFQIKKETNITVNAWVNGIVENVVRS